MIPAIEAFAGGDRLLVVVTGGVGTEELRSRYPHDNVLIEDFVDFDLLFPHTELYVTNGGLGGVLLALSHGVPLLIAGTREGKGDINARLAYRGLAVDLRTETPSARCHRPRRRARAQGQRDEGSGRARCGQPWPHTTPSASSSADCSTA